MFYTACTFIVSCCTASCTTQHDLSIGLWSAMAGFIRMFVGGGRRATWRLHRANWREIYALITRRALISPHCRTACTARDSIVQLGKLTVGLRVYGYGLFLFQFETRITKTARRYVHVIWRHDNDSLNNNCHCQWICADVQL